MNERTGQDHKFSGKAEPPIRSQDGDGVDVPVNLSLVRILFRVVIVFPFVAESYPFLQLDWMELEHDRNTHIFASTYPTMRPLWSSATKEICGQVIAWYIPSRVPKFTNISAGEEDEGNAQNFIK